MGSRNSALFRYVMAVACTLAVLATATARGQAQDLDITAIFWCEGEGEALEPEDPAALRACQAARETILYNCTSCHTFVPIVLSQKTREEWNATLTAHRPRVPELSEEQWEQVLDYLATHFNPETPPPAIPAELLGGTNQAF